MTIAAPRRRLRRLLALLLAAGTVLLVAEQPAHADYVTISGAGSTWSAVAIQAWARDLRPSGVTVNYSDTGSSDGRAQFRYGTVDFAVSEIPFQNPTEDGTAPEISPRPFAYLPIVAGGTSFMYHLTLGGQRVTDLRLSGETITKIFTGVITNWSDPQITADYGRPLPNLKIVPVVRSDGSGTSAQFSLYMSKRYPALWNAFCQKYAGRTPPCGLTSFYSQFPGSRAQSGSNGVANYVAASYGEGAITYVEYAYAKNLGFPVAKVLNNAGYYTLPTASDVAVALDNSKGQGAVINADLTQNLDGVYGNNDPRTYPLSSYSYMIVPTDTHAPFNVDKGKTLSAFINYFLCAGQQKADILGYSPLPINLVQAGFAQVRRIPGSLPPPTDLAACNNPTFQGGRNVLLANAPMPSPCDKVGAAANCAATPGAPGAAAPRAGAPTVTGARPTTAAGAAAGGANPVAGATAGAGVGAGQAGAGAPSGAGTTIDPDTGQALDAGGAGTAAGNATVVTLGADRTAAGLQRVLGPLAALELLLAALVPSAVAAALRRRRTALRRAQNQA